MNCKIELVGPVLFSGYTQHTYVCEVLKQQESRGENGELVSATKWNVYATTYGDSCRPSINSFVIEK
jgi:hypothetical protein